MRVGRFFVVYAMHEMTLVREHEGTEEWLCPSCGRRLLIEWQPKWRRVVVDEGDPSVTHAAMKNMEIDPLC